MWTAGTDQKSFGIAIPYLQVLKTDTNDSANETIELADVQIYGRSMSQSLPVSPIDRSRFDDGGSSRNNSDSSVALKRPRSGGYLNELG